MPPQTDTSVNDAGRQPMKILIAWTGVAGYAADCCRRVAARPNVELKVIVEPQVIGREFDTARTLHDLDYSIVSSVEELDKIDIGCPDIIFVCGWRSRIVRSLVSSRAMRNVPKILCCDMPWRWQLRCIAARFVLWPYLRKFEGILVPGHMAAKYARWLGFSPKRIFHGMNSIDTKRFASAASSYAGERRGFLYVGRNAPEKRLDLLEKAHARYRELGGTWELDIYGGANFVQPDSVPQLYATHAALVLASDFEPWGMVVLEAASAGMPVICTDVCGARHELVRGNGIVVPHGNADAFARAMLRMEREHASFDVKQGAAMAAEYDCDRWADRVQAIAVSMTTQ